MIRLAKLSVFAFFAGVYAAAGAGDSGHLTADQMAKAARTDSFSIPTPGELFAALGKPGKTNWSGQYRGPIPVTYRNRAQIALNLGGLIAGNQIVTAAIVKDYSENNARVLRQPALVHLMQAKINEISPELRGEPLVKDVNEQLGELEKLVSFPPTKAPTVDDVRKINQAVSRMMTEIESKDLPK